MTMADTVAVMNAGRIEQMGSPTDIYESPQTVFVANFLGQSNLIPGEVTGTDGDRVVVAAHGLKLAVTSARNSARGSAVIVGVRPEKLGILPAARESAVPTGHNVVPGTVTDASFTGVSTQYLVAAPWGQELMVFEQNLAVGERVRTGDPVVMHWAPEHSFGLDGSQDLTAGVDDEVRSLEAVNASLVGTNTTQAGG